MEVHTEYNSKLFKIGEIWINVAQCGGGCNSFSLSLSLSLSRSEPEFNVYHTSINIDIIIQWKLAESGVRKFTNMFVLLIYRLKTTLLAGNAHKQKSETLINDI